MFSLLSPSRTSLVSSSQGLMKSYCVSFSWRRQFCALSELTSGTTRYLVHVSALCCEISGLSLGLAWHLICRELYRTRRANCWFLSLHRAAGCERAPWVRPVSACASLPPPGKHTSFIVSHRTEAEKRAKTSCFLFLIPKNVWKRVENCLEKLRKLVDLIKLRKEQIKGDKKLFCPLKERWNGCKILLNHVTNECLNTTGTLNTARLCHKEIFS